MADLTRREFLAKGLAAGAAAGGAGLLGPLLAGCSRSGGRRSAALSNVVLISLDTVRADHLGCYGYDRDTSPSLDRLARRGVLYEHAYAQAPWTLVSHMSVFTSMLPSTHKVESINQVLSTDVPLMAELLKGAGLQTAALVNDGQMKAHWGFARGFGLWREFPVLTPDSRRVADEGRAENITSEAIAWLKTREVANRRDKFFLFLHYFDAHDPYDPPAPYDKMFEPARDIALRGEDTGLLLQQFRAVGAKLPDDRLLPKLVSLYDGEIRYNDHHLGRLFDALDRLQLAEDTLVIVFSDHGEEFKEHGSLVHGGTLYNEALHVPLIVSWPGHVPEGARAPQPARLIDILPTVLHLCGLPPHAQAEGRSLVPVEYNAARYAEIDVRAETKALLEGTALKSLQLGSLKYIYSPITTREELYDLATDPGERRNVASSFAAIAELRGELARWLSRTEDYWIVELHPGAEYATFAGALELERGRFGVVVPVGFDLLGADGLSFNEQLSRVRFSASARTVPKLFFFQPAPAGAPVKFDLRIDAAEAPLSSVLIGSTRDRPVAMPFTLDLTATAEPPFRLRQDKAAESSAPSIRISRYRSADFVADARRAGGVRRPNAELLRQLRQLGYVQ